MSTFDVKKSKDKQEVKSKGKRIKEMESQFTENIHPKKKRKILQISESKIEDKITTNETNKEETSALKEEQNSQTNRKSVEMTESSSDATLDARLAVDKSFSVLTDHVSKKTLSAIGDMGYTEMTEIQAQTFPYSLKGKNIMGTSKTGSGKTLAFLIPAIELVYKLKFAHYYGTGSIILCPTRELAMQTFTVLQKLMKYHHHAYSLLIGGVDRKVQAEKLEKGVAIIVATPGRLLDHMKNTPYFVYSNVMCLVIDEADQMLDIGFEDEIRQILNMIPNYRQNILFAATKSERATMLSELVFYKKTFVYVGIDDNKDEATVESLDQGFVVCPGEKRFLLLFILLKLFRKMKLMVFFSSCMSVKYHGELLNYINTPVMSIHGKQKQTLRKRTFSQFCKAKSGTLLCTNVTARGLDIPNVDWIIQYDPPDDPKDYIHRVGRTARAGSKGKAVLFLRPEEFRMVDYLNCSGVPMDEYLLTKNKTFIDRHNIELQLEKLLSMNYYLRNSAQMAYKAYMRSYDSHPLKEIFNVENLDLAAVAKSFGLITVPR